MNKQIFINKILFGILSFQVRLHSIKEVEILRKFIIFFYKLIDVSIKSIPYLLYTNGIVWFIYSIFLYDNKYFQLRLDTKHFMSELLMILCLALAYQFLKKSKK